MMQSQRQTAPAAPGTGDAAPASAAADPLAAYRGAGGVYDELRDREGRLRPMWRGLSSHLGRLGVDAFGRRWDHSQRLIRENGVAYTLPGPDGEAPRPWRLDPLPMLVSAAEWDTVRAGLEQRARLLGAVLEDLFGPQELIRNGVLPEELLYRHPGYRLALRRGPIVPARASDAQMLRYYAADLGRSPQGDWWVLADRTEAPSGLGFALENRVVVSRMLAEPFREGRVRRLAPFFARLREALAATAPEQVRNPRVAILSQGPGDANYFEDAYLARYLGYTLAEGEDLTVRRRRLWMKTLEGLAPIDVLVRRPNTAACDPLELDGNSPSGVAGLAQAERDGLVAVFNPLGSGLVESPAFLAFMPTLCQAVLGEDLRLPGVATYWCGQRQTLERVLQDADKWVFKRAYRRRGQESLLAAELDGLSAADRERRLRAEPYAYVAQERIERSCAPAWQDGSVAASRVALRAYAVLEQDRFTLLDGALARTTPSGEPLEASAASGEGSKDVWVVSDEPVEPLSLLPDEGEPVELVRFGAEVPSRVVDNAFWLGRTLERADAKARLLRTMAGRLSGEGDPAELPELPALLRALVDQGQIEPGYAVDGLRDALPRLERSFPALALDATQGGSLRATIDRVFTLAAKVRDRLSADAWRLVLRLREGVSSIEPGAADLTDLINTNDEVVLDLAALGGLVVESMTRTQFYRLLDIGRRLERAAQTVALLQACLLDSPGAGKPRFEALLETCDSLMTYRARYRASFEFAAVLDLLLTDESNPRSVAFQLQTLERHVGKLPRGENAAPGASVEERLAMSMAHAVRMADAIKLADSHEVGDAQQLSDLLGQLDRELPALSDAVSLTYLIHSGLPRQLSPM